MPNYGWSSEPEDVPTLLYLWMRPNVRSDRYCYEVTGTRCSSSVSTDVCPDESWLREDPVYPTRTTTLVLDRPAGKLALAVNGGSGTGLYDPGQRVAISAKAAPSGKRFSRWIGDASALEDPLSPTTTSAVAGGDLTVTALFVEVTYRLTVMGGSGTGDYPEGRNVVADALRFSPDQSLMFDRWTGDVETLKHPWIYSTLLVMPKRDITVRANFRPKGTVRVEVVGGTGSGYYKPGERVSISAPAQSFVRWGGNTVFVDDENSASTFIIVPVRDVKVDASGKADPSGVPEVGVNPPLSHGSRPRSSTSATSSCGHVSSQSSEKETAGGSLLSPGAAALGALFIALTGRMP